jgi:hypothetical protein
MKNSRSFWLPPFPCSSTSSSPSFKTHRSPLSPLLASKRAKKAPSPHFSFTARFSFGCTALHRILPSCGRGCPCASLGRYVCATRPRHLSLETPITPSRDALLFLSFPSLLPQSNLMSTRSKSGSPSGDGKSKKRNRKVASCSFHFPSTSSSLPPRSRLTTTENPS